MRITVKFNQNTATIYEHDNETILSKKTVKALSALIWMSRQGIKWGWLDEETATGERS